MKELSDILSNFGFPVSIAFYLLFRFEKKLETLNDSIREMTQKVEENTKIVDNCRGRRK